MANPEHVAILKTGVEGWNRWRHEHRGIVPDLSYVALGELVQPNSTWEKIDFCFAHLKGACLYQVNLAGASFYQAALEYADLTRACVAKANFGGATLYHTNLHGSNLNWANLAGAGLESANLTSASLHATDFTKACFGNTVLSGVCLTAAKGLETIRHSGPSILGIDMLHRPDFTAECIPESFLRGIGLQEALLSFMKSEARTPIQFYSCFISYSTVDQEFADRLHTDLQVNGVRCWLASEDLKIGDSFRIRIDESIRFHDKLLLLLSEHSVHSAWVQEEVETALERERREHRPVLFPIRIDDAVMETDVPWAASIKRTRHIGDFGSWRSHDSYQAAFQRLMRDLKAQ